MAFAFVPTQGEAGIGKELTPEGQEDEGSDDSSGGREKAGGAVQRPGTVALWFFFASEARADLWFSRSRRTSRPLA